MKKTPRLQGAQLHANTLQWNQNAPASMPACQWKIAWMLWGDGLMVLKELGRDIIHLQGKKHLLHARQAAKNTSGLFVCQPFRSYYNACFLTQMQCIRIYMNSHNHHLAAKTPHQPQ
jgi:hypothetical protein